MRRGTGPLAALLALLTGASSATATPNGESGATVPPARRVASIAIVGASHAAAWTFVAAAWWIDRAVSLRLSYVPSRDYLEQRSARARLDLLEDYSGQT